MTRTLIYVGPLDDVSELLYGREDIDFVRVDDIRAAREHLLSDPGSCYCYLVAYSVRVAACPDAPALDGWGRTIVLGTATRPPHLMALGIRAERGIVLPEEWHELYRRLNTATRLTS